MMIVQANQPLQVMPGQLKNHKNLLLTYCLSSMILVPVAAEDLQLEFGLELFD
jgi:hypothetical protein